MTFNVEFMWDGIQPEEGQATFPWKGDQVECEKRMAEIATIIKRNQPDMIALVEVEGEAALTRLNEQYLAEEGYRVYFEEGKDTYLGQDVCLLSKYEVTEFGRIDLSTGKTYGVSKNFYAFFTVAGEKFAMLGVHFLSNPGSTKKIEKRQAQAEVIGSAGAKFADQGYHVIILGDVNDYDSDACCADHIQSEAITTVLTDLKTLHNEDSADDLVNVSQFIDEEKRYTAHWDKNKNQKVDNDGELTSIDHILISQALTEDVEMVVIDQEPLEGRVSDHYPIMVILEIE